MNSYSSLSLKIAIVIIFGLALTVISGNSPAEAQAQSSTHSISQKDGFIPDSYQYLVEECNNYTLLVRKSIQLYDKSNTNVSFSEAQIIFIETNIINEINASDLIFSGDKIDVATSLIKKYSTLANNLSDEQTKAWQGYANNSSFEHEDIVPINVVQNDDGTISDIVTTNTEQTTGVKGDNDISNSTETDSNAFWWIIGGLSVSVLWYLLWQRGGELE
jgi:hypothetical protein